MPEDLPPNRSMAPCLPASPANRKTRNHRGPTTAARYGLRHSAVPWFCAVLALGSVCCARPTTSSQESTKPASSTAADRHVHHDGQKHSATSPTTSVAPPSTGLRFIDNDIERASKLARRTHRLLFVDAWAPWCHTCSSLKHYVFTSPSLTRYEKHFVFASIDTDRPSSARFLEHHDVTVWPTLFILDPSRGLTLASWPGSLSVEQLRGFLDDALALQDASTSPSDPRHLLARARAFAANRQWIQAIAAYDELLAQTKPSWSRRSEALVGKMWALFRQGDYQTCASWGARHIDRVHGAASPADFSWALMECARRSHSPKLQKTALRAAIRRLRAITESPPAGATVDDRADALALLADALDQTGHHDRFRKLHEQRLALLERAARQAPTPTIASTFDYARAKSYLALGRGDEAVALLRKRIEQLPDSYEPPGRLGEVLIGMNQPARAIPWLERALRLAYGPRRMRYLKLEAQAYGKLGRIDEQIRTLKAEVAGYEKLPKSQLRPGALQDARRRLAGAIQSKMSKR